ncbi:MAG: TonB-dependent receptor [Bacteroidota bacterium]|nr:TonB-dependent receptor [Bacteroidota bacterium]
MNKKLILFQFLLWIPVYGQSQLSDSIALEEIIITATKTERLLSRIPMPVSFISKKDIQNTSSSRLQDILAEQIGLNIVSQVNGLGNGIQIQGLNPEYTLIMIDGQPLIGRYTGTLELSRITVANIKKVEIVKGPSSSLYGSEALGGVINIITEKYLSPKLNASLKYLSNHSFDGSLDGNIARKKLNIGLFSNYYSSQGYDLSPDIYGQTVSPYHNYTLQSKLTYTPDSRHEINLNLRYFNEHQANEFQVVNFADSIRVYGTGLITDWNISPSYQWKIYSGTHLILRSYYSQYETKTVLSNFENGLDYYRDQFRQSIFRPEFQINHKYKNHAGTLGSGIILEQVNTSRYGDDKQRKQQTFFSFIQHEWTIRDKWEVISGLRYDQNSSYKDQFSPKIAIHYSIQDNLSIKASFGLGFKAPDFRQLYLNFNNNAAGYSVYGTEVLKSELETLKSNNDLEEIFIDPDKLGTLGSENSRAYNVGMDFKSGRWFNISFNMFRNELKDLIETHIVALTKDQKFIYSYTNVKKALTQGFEIQIEKKLSAQFSISSGYQLLYAIDRDVLNEVKNGLVYGRDPISLESYKISVQDYFGLYNRSRHSGNVKLFFLHPESGWESSLRILFRGKYGISNISGSVQGNTIPSSDQNSNTILDSRDHFVDPYATVNLTLAKSFFNKRLRTQIGVENLLNHTDVAQIPNLQGRIFSIGLHYQFYKN